MAVKWSHPCNPLQPWNTFRPLARDKLRYRSTRTATPESQRITCRLGVSPEHAHGIEREIVEVATKRRKLLEDVGGNRDDLAIDLSRLHDIQQLAGTGPDQLH